MKCKCLADTHRYRQIVLTGGPGAGKTAVLELVRKYFCEHVFVVPESASLIFGGGFPRVADSAGIAAAQRAIYFVQRELEALAQARPGIAIGVCDRGTIDGLAYWPHAEAELWRAVHSDKRTELARYSAVIHLRTPEDGNGYNRVNRLRIESAAEARAIDEKIARAWDGHPRRYFIESTSDFLVKARATLARILAELPDCCRSHDLPDVVSTRPTAAKEVTHA